MTLRTTALVMAAAALVAAAGCGSGPGPKAGARHEEGPPLAGTEWRLTSYRAPGDARVPVPVTYDGTLHLDGRGHFDAKICNGKSGGASVDGRRLALTPGVQTLIGCTPLAVEDEFDATIRSGVRWTIAGRTLTLTSRDGHELTFRA